MTVADYLAKTCATVKVNLNDFKINFVLTTKIKTYKDFSNKAVSIDGSLSLLPALSLFVFDA